MFMQCFQEIFGGKIKVFYSSCAERNMGEEKMCSIELGNLSIIQLPKTTSPV